MADDLFETPFGIDDEHPDSKVPSEEDRNKSPVAFGNWLISVAERGQRAAKQGDELRAIQYYRAIAKAVPDSAGGFRRLCEAYQALGQLDTAEQYCAAALSREGGEVGDYSRYVRVVLGQKGPLAKAKIADLDAAIAHVRTQTDDKVFVTELECLVALKLQDVSRMSRCTKAMKALAPNSALTIGHEWRLAILKLDRAAAQRAIARARQHGVDPKQIRAMEVATRHLITPFEKTLRAWLPSAWIALGAIAGLVVLAFIALRLRRAARHAPEPGLQDSNAGVR